MLNIKNYVFDQNTSNKLKHQEYCNNWPVVYILNSDKEVYVGETVNASRRVFQHYQNKDRKRLTSLSVISDDDFNKSVILDLENFLITHIAADGKFKLQNSNYGNSPHNYYEQNDYEKKFPLIWDRLQKLKLANTNLKDIDNSDIFKYSPYKSLSPEQYEIVYAIIEHLAMQKEKNKKSTIIIKGGAGTGKTVIAVYLIKLLSELKDRNLIFNSDDLSDSDTFNMVAKLKELGAMKIGIVVPMQSFRSTIKKVFKNVNNLSQKMVLSPMDVPKDQYDLLIVDEAHRLRQRKALSNYKSYDDNNRKLNLDNEGTELDWILRSSKNQILLYDSQQSVKPSDIDKSRFDELKRRPGTVEFSLKSQLRCLGGSDYIKYIKEIIDIKPPVKKIIFKNYELIQFTNIKDMVQAIKEKDKIWGLCRVVAGYSWKWKSKKDHRINDITIDGEGFKWNTVNKDWVNSENAINEIGCIHTIQGYDLNYAGVIFGEEIKYDPLRKTIVIDKKNYYDLQGKTALKNEEALKEYITNIYKTLLTRGIQGTYIYVCDKELRKYLSQFIETVN